MEEKREKFTRIVEKRTNKILEQIRLLGNCSNKHNYSYTEEDVKKIFSAIESEIKAAKLKYTSQVEREKFKLN